MAKASRFAALADFRQAKETEGEAPAESTAAPIGAEATNSDASSPAVDKLSVAQEAVVAPEPPRGRGRPPGKRSDPAWKLYSHFLKRKTQREAAALLLDRDDGRDLSDVLQGLLEGWLADQRRTGA